jgi:hypothetical protein
MNTYQAQYYTLFFIIIYLFFVLCLELRVFYIHYGNSSFDHANTEANHPVLGYGHSVIQYQSKFLLKR